MITHRKFMEAVCASIGTTVEAMEAPNPLLNDIPMKEGGRDMVDGKIVFRTECPPHKWLDKDGNLVEASDEQEE
jgi:hypothetical protein